jgi:mRNA interferase MazF
MDMAIDRFDIWLVNLDPTIGKEIKKTRPCLVISPDEANKHLSTVMGAPMTTTIRNYPTRISCVFRKKKGEIAIDQARALDKIRFVKKIGKLDEQTCRKVCEVLVEYFSY